MEQEVELGADLSHQERPEDLKWRPRSRRARSRRARSRRPRSRRARSRRARSRRARSKEGEITEAEITEGEITEGEITEGEITEGEITEAEITEAGLMQTEIMDGEITETEAACEQHFKSSKPRPHLLLSLHLLLPGGVDGVHHPLDGEVGDGPEQREPEQEAERLVAAQGARDALHGHLPQHHVRVRGHRRAPEGHVGLRRSTFS
ncbi:hypothetical protein EYF80_036356 [Liparis tanakae]|uniref:Uncharacterized protein n=1 Tax=Liparis tanakae TaxID=230148 RepID=A0A4Z2GJ19_9TELE|nr:hypothetical protein EYF80_036356 [Liparis tanakae]